MAEHKKSFLLYSDIIGTVEMLSDKQAGVLFKHILRYVNDKNPTTNDGYVKLVFEPIKNALKRDLIKYQGIKELRSKAGKASANKRKQELTRVESDEQTSTNSTVSVIDSVIVNDNILLKDTSSPPNGVDILHFYIAKGFYNLFLLKGKTKTLDKAKLTHWVKVIRLLINEDNVTIEQLVAIKYYFEKCQQGDRSVKTWWFENINSVAAFRKKNKDNEYHYDKITIDIKKWVNSNPDIQAEVLTRTKKLKEKTT